MTLQLANEKDKLAMLQILGWDTDQDFSPTTILANIADSQAPEGEDMEFIIHQSMVTPAYRGNPSLLARVAVARTQHFKSASGCRMPDDNYLKVIFFRSKPANSRYSHKFSVKAHVRNWLETRGDDSSMLLEIPIADIPESYKTRPEQFTYQIKRETGHKISIRRLKARWIISYVPS